METVAASHVWLDEQGVAWIDDTNVKVIEIALDQIANGWSAEEIHRQDPGVSMAQVHAALAYYYDHKQHFDEEIERDLREAEELAAQVGESPFERRMRAAGKLP
jgi:uncharacterized protein (DUF433 family)